MTSLYVLTALYGCLASFAAFVLSSIVTAVDLLLVLVLGKPGQKIDPPKTILITGATSGIGEALAKDFAARDVVLALTGRNEERLRAVSDECSAAGATVITKALDVTDEESMREWIEEVDARYPVDLVVASAGVSEGTIKAQNDPVRAARELLPINISGVMHTVLPLVPHMKARGRGQVCLLSSLAGFGPITSSAAYSGSKAFVKTWGEALRTELACFGISVNVCCPGFVRSPMTDVNTFMMPGLISMSECVQYVREGLAADLPLTAFPSHIFCLAQLAGMLPPVVKDALARWRALPGLYFYRRRKPRSSDGSSSSSSSSSGAAADKAKTH